MLDIYLIIEPDFDHKVDDVVMIIDGEKSWIKGFDDDEWEETKAFAEKLAAQLGIELRETD